MEEVMKFIQEVLSIYAPTRYQDLERDADGKIKLTETSITYNIDNTMYNNLNEAKLSIPMSVDIWYRRKDIYKIEKLVRDITMDLANRVVHSEDSTVFTIKKSSNFIINIPDVNKDILRKQVNFNIRYYK